MKDTELLTLKSFVYAVMRQENLPDDLQQRIQAIAHSLDTRVAELGPLARSSPLLQMDYRQAYRYLSSSAAERGLGATPADYDEDGPAYEPSNIVSAPERYRREQTELNEIDSKLNQASSEDARQALLSKNPIGALINWLKS